MLNLMQKYLNIFMQVIVIKSIFHRDLMRLMKGIRGRLYLMQRAHTDAPSVHSLQTKDYALLFCRQKDLFWYAIIR